MEIGKELRIEVEHPLVHAARRLARRDPWSGEYAFESEAIVLLEELVLAEETRTTSPLGVIGLFALAEGLLDHGSLDAASDLVQMLGRIGPKTLARFRQPPRADPPRVELKRRGKVD